jgi:tetratricopeptide (TPR) repeat protein
MLLGKLCLAAFVAAVDLCAQISSQIATDIRLGQMLQSDGRLAEAELRFQSAVQLATQTPTPTDTKIGALANLASVQIDRSNMDDAASTYNRALKILQTESPGNREGIRKLQVQLAELYLEGGEDVIALGLARRVIKNAVVEPPAPAIAYALDVLASLYAHQRKFAAAEKAERQSLSMFAMLRDPESAWIAIGTLHLSSFLNHRNKPAEALPYAIKALEMLSALPLQQPAMEALADLNLASIYSHLKRPTEAEIAGQAAINTAQAFYGLNHPKIAEILLAETPILRAIGKKREARELQTRAEQMIAGNRGTRLNTTIAIDALFPR